MQDSTKVLLIPIGIAGSGKTTYIEKIINKLKQENRTVEKVSIDNFDRLYSELSLAHNMCLRKVFELMENRVENIILDNTNLKSTDWYDYLFIACNNGYRVYFMLPGYDLTYYNTGFTNINHQFEYIKSKRSTIIDINKQNITENIIDKMYKDFIFIKKFIKNNKDVCQCEPHLWIKLCE